MEVTILTLISGIFALLAAIFAVLLRTMFLLGGVKRTVDNHEKKLGDIQKTENALKQGCLLLTEKRND